MHHREATGPVDPMMMTEFGVATIHVNICNQGGTIASNLTMYTKCTIQYPSHTLKTLHAHTKRYIITCTHKSYTNEG